MSRAYTIADVHGRLDLLAGAIDAAEQHAGEAGGTLVVLGDFVDRGPESAAIVELLMAGPQRPSWRWIVLQGNHEDMMVRSLANLGLLRWWIGNGGGATLHSYGYCEGDPVLPLKVPEEHMAWLSSLPLFHQDEHRIFVHAGVPFDQDPGAARRETLQWMLYPGDVDGPAETHPDEPHVSGKHIVHGHYQSAAHPLLKPHRTNLDSFAWHTGRLVVGVFDDGLAGGPVEVLEVRI